MNQKPKQEAIIRNWQICTCCSSSVYSKPIKHLHGQFFHHPNQYNCPDGSWGCTTEIIDMNEHYAETKNTMYTLENQAQ